MRNLKYHLHFSSFVFEYRRLLQRLAVIIELTISFYEFQEEPVIQHFIVITTHILCAVY